MARRTGASTGGGTRTRSTLRLPSTGTDRGRRRLRAVSAVALVLGSALLGLGGLAPGVSADQTPRALAAGAVTAVPPVGAFGGRSGVYGRVDDARRVPAAELGCVLLDDEGRVVRNGLTVTGLDTLDRVVVDEVAVRPLLRVDAAGAAVRCTGPGVAALQPTYVRSQAGVDAMVPMAAGSLASLLAVLGLTGVVVLRPRGD